MALVHTQGFRPHVQRESAWFWPIAAELARFDAHARFPTAEELSAAYAARNAALELPPLRFVTEAKLKRRRGAPIDTSALYEGRIVERREVPTRADDWHDLFNALAFIVFPRAKQALHARQYALLRARIAPGAKRLPNARTREQDALSLFDEGGLCVVAPPARAAPLRELIELDAANVDSSLLLVPFGHALYEHMVAGLPCPLATPFVIELEEKPRDERSLLNEVDARLAAALSDPNAFRTPSSARGSSLLDLPVRAPAR